MISVEGGMDKAHQMSSYKHYIIFEEHMQWGKNCHECVCVCRWAVHACLPVFMGKNNVGKSTIITDYMCEHSWDKMHLWVGIASKYDIYDAIVLYSWCDYPYS